MSETHEHEHQGEGFGVALGFRIFEDEGEMWMAEAEVSSYVDDPAALGATLVFHSLTELDPTADPELEDVDEGVRVDIDDELQRDEKASIRDQFQSIVRQLAGLGEGELRAYLKAAREESGTDDEE